MASEPPAKIWDDLRSKSQETRASAARELQYYVATVMPELSAEAAWKLWDEHISRNLFELIKDKQAPDALGALLAIDVLSDYLEGEEFVELGRILFRFLNYLLLLFPNTDNSLMIAASRTVGKVLKSGGSSFGESFIDKEVPRAVELLAAPEKDPGRYGGVLLLRELARTCPTHVYKHVPDILGKLYPSFKDSRSYVREGAADLLGTCLEILNQRERQYRGPLVVQVLGDAQTGLKSVSSTEAVHGALLEYRALFLHAGNFMREHYSKSCDAIFQFRSHKEVLVRRSVVMLIPTLAAYDTAAFCENFLHTSMIYLLGQLSKPAERAFAFVAIGHIAKPVRSEIKSFLEPIMKNVKEGLLQAHGAGKKGGQSEEPLFQCIGMLATSVGPNLTRYLHDQLDLIFACQLSEPLHQALVAIARHIEPLLRTVQDRLLDMLSLILAGQSYRPVGAPPTPARQDPSATASGTAPRDAQQIKLALDILGSFDFSGHVLNEFVRVAALPYLDDDNSELRHSAALTCCKLFVKEPIWEQTSMNAVETINEVLDKLLQVGVADPDPNIRLTVLQNLDKKFDRHLAQAEHVRAIFVAVNDEVFNNRVAAIQLVGRLAAHNPAHIMPSLRKALSQLMTELQYSPLQRGKEESARLLTTITSATQPLIRSYALSMLRVLLPKASDPNPAVAANAIMCLGELATVGGEDYLPHVPELMRIMIACLKDSGDYEKRNAALHSLGQVCASTSYVVDPWVDYPDLLPALIKILGQEQDQDVRREVVKVMGILGAIDPYRRKGVKVEESPLESNAVRANAVQASVPLGGSANEEYYQSVVIGSLLRVLQDPSLSTSSYAAIDALMSIFKTQGMKGAVYLDKVLPAFLSVIRSSTSRFQETYLQQLAILVGIVKQHIRNHLSELFWLVDELWTNASLHVAIVGLVEALGKALDTEFRPFLPTVLPTILKVFDGDLSDKRQQAQIQALRAFISFGNNIEEYLHLVIPAFVKACEGPGASTALRKQAVQTIDSLSRRLNFSDHVSRIVHPLIRTLAINNPELRAAIMDTLCALVFQLGSEFTIFVPMINKCLYRNRIQHAKFDGLIQKLNNGERLPQEFGQIDLNDSQGPDLSETVTLPRNVVNQQHLKQAWDTSAVSTRDDWLEWYRRVSIEFLKESPSHALRACTNLLDPGMSGGKELARELFTISFLSCWTELYDNYQIDLVSAIEAALVHPNIPPEVVLAFLSLAEFMEHQDRALFTDSKMLGELSFTFQAYAKALHYKELEFFTDNSHAVLEDLLNINQRLQQHDAAFGVLKVAKMTDGHFDLARHEEWYERLGRWQEALEGYERMADTDPDALDVAMGRIRCLHALGEWDQLARIVDDNWERSSHEDRKRIAPMAAAAAWALNDWDAMDDYMAAMSNDSPDRFFYRAILAVHRNHFAKAMTQIERARDLLENEFTPLIGEDYGRSYKAMVRAQTLSELEEIIVYKQCSDQPERQETIKKTWMKRLQGCQPEVEIWQRVLQVRALVLNPIDDNAMWVKFANLCRKNNRVYLAEKTFASITPDPAVDSRGPHNVVYARMKSMWANGEKEDALVSLLSFSNELEYYLSHPEASHDGRPWSARAREYSNLLARCHLKQGQWQMASNPAWVEDSSGVLTAFEFATRYDPTWYKAWHTWALANVEVINHIESHDTRQDESVPEAIATRAVAAVEGLLRSISLGKQNSLQDTLRLLTLWFKFGNHDDVSHAVGNGFSMVSVDTWLDVIPQIIARIQTPSANIGRNITFLLNDIGKQHPQALVYPLTVASKSPSASRKDAALKIMDRMREHNPMLVEQALVVSQELIRVAILWHELWHEGLEEASRLYFTEKNPDAMIATLEPLHELMEKGPTTTREISFVHTFGRDLLDARRACQRYRMYGEARELDRAWDIYYMVFRKVEKQLPLLTTLDLQYVSPALLQARNLVLAVPGTYESGKEELRIQSFSSKLAVISSKKRPRRLTVKGSDGNEYEFGLKGHEDLRQDERVMQFFGLVNNLLSNDADSYTRQLHIQRCPIIPLAPNAGLIGWVRDTDTFHILVRDYREARKLLLNLEMRLMLQMAPDYEDLTLLQKVEVFQHAMDETTGQDLYRLLWLKSVNSEAWLTRRTTFTRSLAVTSMLGYVIGLGDRHPSNILMHRGTGKIVHIDYGDCFEVTMMRDKYPEKVPFRLTRMLVNAMEVTGIHGSFKNTCEITVRVLRDNRESLLAVLEAFVYDPLISWRLVQTDTDTAETRDDADVGEDQDAYDDGPMRRQRADENDIFNDTAGRAGAKHEVRNERALFVYNRVQNKLTGRDFKPNVVLSIPTQVDKLIHQATSIENLCQHFPGWCAYW